MSASKLSFVFLSPWLMGSGFGEGANLDSVPVKSPAGLPYIPGKSVKGLLREAVLIAEENGQLPSGTTRDLFGSRNPDESRYESTAGLLRFTSATLGDAMEAWAAEKQNSAAVDGLYTTIAATRIDGNGLAEDKSLRKIEAALPLTLTAEVEGPDDGTLWCEQLKTALPLVRQAGSHRHRGLGRVQLTLEVTP